MSTWIFQAYIFLCHHSTIVYFMSSFYVRKKARASFVKVSELLWCMMRYLIFGYNAPSFQAKNDCSICLDVHNFHVSSILNLYNFLDLTWMVWMGNLQLQIKCNCGKCCRYEHSWENGSWKRRPTHFQCISWVIGYL